jgi:hypothetical protein
MKLLDTSKPTATRAIEVLAEIGILAETTGKKRDRSFAYRAYMERLRTGTELDLSAESPRSASTWMRRIPSRRPRRARHFNEAEARAPRMQSKEAQLNSNHLVTTGVGD